MSSLPLRLRVSQGTEAQAPEVGNRCLGGAYPGLPGLPCGGISWRAQQCYRLYEPRWRAFGGPERLRYICSNSREPSSLGDDGVLELRPPEAFLLSPPPFYNLWLWLIRAEKQAVFCLSTALMNFFLMRRDLWQDSQGPRVSHF